MTGLQIVLRFPALSVEEGNKEPISFGRLRKAFDSPLRSESQGCGGLFGTDN
jgi:hypothetical protein